MKSGALTMMTMTTIETEPLGMETNFNALRERAQPARWMQQATKRLRGTMTTT